MVESHDRLNQLRDIHLPAPIGWWPLAKGWMVLLCALFVILLAFMYWVYRRHQNARPKKEALRLLKQYQNQYIQDNDGLSCAIKLSELLRRVALVYYPRSEVAGLKGNEWLTFLSTTGKNLSVDAVRFCLIERPYQPTGATIEKEARHDELEPLFHFTKAWIRQRGAPCSN